LYTNTQTFALIIVEDICLYSSSWRSSIKTSKTKQKKKQKKPSCLSVNGLTLEKYISAIKFLFLQVLLLLQNH